MCRQPGGRGSTWVIGEYHGTPANSARQDAHAEAVRLYSPKEFYTIAAMLSESQVAVLPALWRSSQIHEAQVARLFVH